MHQLRPRAQDAHAAEQREPQIPRGQRPAPVETLSRAEIVLPQHNQDDVGDAGGDGQHRVSAHPENDRRGVIEFLIAVCGRVCISFIRKEK